MKKLKPILIILFLSIAKLSFTQTIGDYIDVVHLKNGSKIKGVMIEQIPSKSIKIRTSDGSEYVYEVSEIEKFTREEKIKSVSKPLNTQKEEPIEEKIKWMDDYKHKKKGVYKEIDLLFNFSAIGLRVTNGYKFGRFGFFGVAAGIERMKLRSNSPEDIPLFSLNLVYAGESSKNRITPFYQAEIGYGLALERRTGDYYEYEQHMNDFPGNILEENPFVKKDILYYGGPMAALQFGVKFKTKKRILYKIGLDSRLMTSFMDNHENNEKISTIIISSGYGIRFGIGF